MKETTTESQHRRFRDELPVHERIRNRRLAQRLSATELARRAHVSPAYVSLIERGFKVPHERVAMEIARALEDDPELYRHWARAGRYPITSETRRRYDALSSDLHLRRSLAAGNDLPVHRINLLAKAAPIAGQEHHVEGQGLAIPVLPDGTDPGRPGRPLPSTVDALWLDSRLLPPGDAGQLFAYFVGRAASHRLAPMIAEGDCLVMSRRVRQLSPDRVHAVRAEEGITLARLLVYGNTLLLLPPQGGSNFEVVTTSSRKEAMGRIAGASVLTLRRWA